MIETSLPLASSVPHESYQALFVGRTSDFALQLDTGRYRRAGRPLIDREIFAHLDGKQTIGTYVTNEQGRCWFAVFDADSDDGLQHLYVIQDRLAHDGVPSFLEVSRRGGHLWLFFEQAVPASQVRDWFLPYCPADIEFYPKQSEGNGYGSVIRMPFGIHRKTGLRYPFMIRRNGRWVMTRPGNAGIEELLNVVRRIPVPSSRQYPLVSASAQNTHPPLLAKTPLRLLLNSSTTIHAWCAMQDPFRVIGHYVQVNARSVGCCPFGGHHRHGRDRNPSFKVYQPARPGGSCWYCYTWQKGGNVFDFLCHWYNVDARTMWGRIQQGEL